MLKLNFNDNWNWRKIGEEEWKQTTLPHDALIFENRKEGVASGVNLGWYECHDYEYSKTFTVPAEYADKELTFEFEGVYRNAEVYINREKACFRPYGYTNFYVPANEYLKFGE